MANRIVLAFDPTYGFPETILATDNINMQSTGKIVNLAAATTAGDALSYGQSGASLAGLTLTAALLMGGNQINNLGTPTSATDAATKGYVDGLVNGITWKNPVLVVSTSNVALTGEQTIDGVLTSGSRVLLVGQTVASQNGIWVTGSGAWTRPVDFATGAEAANDAVFVEEGTAQADTAWVCTTDPPGDVIDTNNLAFTVFASATSYTASHGLVLVGHDFQVKPGDGIEVVSNSASTNVRLDATAPGLFFTGSAGSGALSVKVDSVTSGNPTLALGSNGLRVIGLPLTFNINSVATSSNVTAANVNTLVGGTTSNADSLHEHALLRGQFVTVGAVSASDAVYWSTTANQVDKARGDTDTKSFVVGVALASASATATADVCFAGLAAGVLSGATPGNVYYLNPTGGISTTLPGGGGNRLVVVGTAKSATDLWVQVRDYGKKF